jgi:hypothetical protein
MMKPTESSSSVSSPRFCARIVIVTTGFSSDVVGVWARSVKMMSGSWAVAVASTIRGHAPSVNGSRAARARRILVAAILMIELIVAPASQPPSSSTASEMP